MRARENPYRSERVTRLAVRLHDVDWGTLLARWEALGRRGALVAPHGHGKSTLLTAFAARLAALDWEPVRVNLSQTRPHLRHDWRDWFAALGGKCVVLLDGAEQLTWWRWRQFRNVTRHLGGLVITTHRAGRLPTLHRCQTTPPLLLELTQELVGDGGPTLAEAEQLLRQHGGNMREVLFALYVDAGKRAQTNTSAALAPGRTNAASQETQTFVA